MSLNLKQILTSMGEVGRWGRGGGGGSSVLATGDGDNCDGDQLIAGEEEPNQEEKRAIDEDKNFKNVIEGSDSSEEDDWKEAVMYQETGRDFGVAAERPLAIMSKPAKKGITALDMNQSAGSSMVGVI